MDGGSWTNNISWVRGYDDVLIPMERASSQFHQRVARARGPQLRPELPQRALTPPLQRDQLLPLLGRGRVDRLRSRARPPRDGDRCARSVSLTPVADVEFALVLSLHQPPGNLEHLLDAQEREATEILWAIDRIPRSLWPYEDIARVHLSLSGSLLETLANPDFQRRVYGIVDCGSLLWYLQNTRIIEVLGTGYYHPVLPLIRPADREEHLHRWRTIAGHLFARDHFPGFWPPELGFSIDLVPALLPPPLQLCDRRQRARFRAHADALGRAALPPSPRPVRRRADRGRGPRPRALQRARVRHGRRLVHLRGQGPHPALRLPPACHDRHRRRERRVVS